MTKLLSSAPISYGPVLPPIVSTSAGALFYKTQSDGLPAGLYLAGFQPDVRPTVGDQVGFDWTPVALSGTFISTAGGSVTGNLESTAGLRVGYGLPTSNSSTFGYAFGADGDTGMFAIGTQPTATKLALYVNSAERLTLNNDSTVLINGNTAWHAGNDGAGSSLDADLLDGQHGSYYTNLTNSTGNLDINTRTTSTLTISRGGTNMTSVSQNGVVYAASVSALTSTAAGTAGQVLAANADGVPTWTNVSLLVSSTAASINNANVGAMTFDWTMQNGTPSYVWGSTTGLISHPYSPAVFDVSSAAYLRVDGVNRAADVAVTSNSIMLRDDNGFAYAGYFNQSSPNSENPQVSQFLITNGFDGYLRKANVAHVANALGLGGFVAKTGDTMSGSLNMNNHAITNVPTPSSNGDVAPKSYVDAAIPAWIAANPQAITAFRATQTPIVTTTSTNWYLREAHAGCLTVVPLNHTLRLYNDANHATNFAGETIPVGSIFSIASTFTSIDFVIDSGVSTILAGVAAYSNGHTFTLSQTALVTLIKLGANSWLLTGAGVTP